MKTDANSSSPVPPAPITPASKRIVPGEPIATAGKSVVPGEPSPIATAGKSVVPGALSPGNAGVGGREAPRLISLDLDGTLLDSQKRITPRTLAALEAAAARGIHVVPTTGRFFDAMPACVRDLPFVRYAVTINGAAVFDRAEGRTISSDTIPLPTALTILDALDAFDVIYDCYMDDAGWNSESNVAKADEYAPDIHYAAMIRDLRNHVPDLKEHLRATGHGVQKILAFSKDPALYASLVKGVLAVAPDIIATSSNPRLTEFNAPGAHKGAALAKLAAHLGFGMEAVMAFGDGLNDLTMVRDAGWGVAMANAVPEVLAAARFTTLSNDDDGVAAAIEELILKGTKK